MHVPSWIDPVPAEKVSELRAQLASLASSQGKCGSGDSLSTIYLFLTRKCNLSCQHCYIEGVGPQARDPDMSLDEIVALIEQARPHGLRKVKISGGEPFVHPQCAQILEYINGLGLKEIVLETNGTLLTEETVKFLTTIQNLTVFISLDHFKEEGHDAFRQRSGAFAKAASALQEIGKAGINSVVTTTANRDNYASIPEIIDLVLGWGITRHRTLLNIHPMGNAVDHADNALALDECEILISSVVKSDHFKLGRAYVTLPPALMPLEHLHGVHTCGWGDNVLGILSTGKISMCSASYDDEEMLAGDVRTQPLMDIWRNSEFFKGLREIGAGRVKGVCGNCVFYSACRGVCRMSSYSHYKEKDAPYPFCQEMYNAGKFPEYALLDPERECSYRPQAIAHTRGLVQLRTRPAAAPTG